MKGRRLLTEVSTKLALLPDPELVTAADHIASVVARELADAFVKMRKAIRKPLTDYGGKLIANDLRKLPDPVAAIEQSIARGYLGVFEPDDKPRGANARPEVDLQAAIRTAAESRRRG